MSNGSVACEFKKFHASNPHVYVLFKKFALEACERRRRFSARTVLHRMRWYSNVESEEPAGFKVNDHWSPFYARLFEVEFPQHADLFNKRPAAADLEAPHGV